MNLRNKVFLGVLTTGLLVSTSMWESGGKVITTPYYDIAGVLTVCDGYAGKDIVKNKQYTKAECDALLERELKRTQQGILECIKVPLKQHQIDAYTLFAYNVGVHAFCTSKTVLEPLNKGYYEVACDGMLKWVYAGGKYSKGLYNRRVYERKMCRGEMNESFTKSSFSISWDEHYYRWIVRDPQTSSGVSSNPS